MTVSDAYARELESIIRDQQQLLQQISFQLRRVELLGKRWKEIQGRRQDPVVLVRTSPGWPAEVFHSAEFPCGRVRSREHFEEVLLGEALARKLRACSACAEDSLTALSATH